MYPSRPSSLCYALEGLEPRSAHCFTCRGLSYRPCADRHPCPVLGLYLYHCLDHREALSPQLGGLCYLASASESPPFPKVHNSMLTFSLPFPPFCYHHPISLREEKDELNLLQEFNPVCRCRQWSRAAWSIVPLCRNRCDRVIFFHLLWDERPRSFSPVEDSHNACNSRNDFFD